MPANVESIFYVEDMPWHKTGTGLTEPPDSKTAIIAAGLDWNVEKTKIYSQNGFEIKNYFGIMRTDNKKILGVVKSNYQPLQNKDAFNFFDPLINSKFLQYETAGALGEGEIVTTSVTMTSFGGSQYRLSQPKWTVMCVISAGCTKKRRKVSNLCKHDTKRHCLTCSTL